MWIKIESTLGTKPEVFMLANLLTINRAGSGWAFGKPLDLGRSKHRKRGYNRHNTYVG